MTQHNSLGQQMNIAIKEIFLFIEHLYRLLHYREH